MSGQSPSRSRSHAHHRRSRRSSSNRSHRRGAADPSRNVAALTLAAIALYGLVAVGNGGSSSSSSLLRDVATAGGRSVSAPAPTDSDGVRRREETAAAGGDAGIGVGDAEVRTPIGGGGSAAVGGTEGMEAGGNDHRGSEPSYVELCRAVLHRERLGGTERGDRAGEMEATTTTTTEDPSFCSDQSSPHAAVMTVFASSLISEAFGLPYEHGCVLPSDGKAVASAAAAGEETGRGTVQQSLPSEWMLLRPGSGGMTAEKLGQVREGIVGGCERIVQTWDAGTDGLGGPEGVLLASIASGVAEGGGGAERSVLQEVFSGLAGMLRAGADRWRSLGGGGAAITSGGGADVSGVDDDSAIIYLSCLDDSCSDPARNPAIALPAYYYAHRILPSASSVTVLSSPSCVSNVPGCKRHGEALRDELRRLFPRAVVTFRVAESTADAYAHMMSARYLTCPPGLSCLLPALARAGYDRSLGGDASILDDPDMYPWFRPLRDEYAPSLGLIPGGSFPTSAVGSDASDPAFFLRERPAPGAKICHLLRGRSGRWVQDMDFARAAQYATPLKRYGKMKVEPTADAPYTSSSTYRWEDDLCPVELVDRTKMCELMGRRGMGRILVVGDSLSLQFAKALWKLLGHEDDPDPSKKLTEGWKPWMQYKWSRTVNCGDSFDTGGQSFTLQFIRNDLLNAETETIDFKEWGKDYNCGTHYSYCFPWLQDYVSYDGPGRTLLVANIGPHLHSAPDFRAVFDDFATNLESVQRAGDVVLLRTTVPGHEGCQEPTVRPLLSHEDFQRTLVEDYKSWHLFADYNDYAWRTVREKNGGASGRGAFHVDMLDVYPMTVLRPDGHEGGPEGCVRCKKDDCLHYTLPGPPDFWVHLMYSNLVDMGLWQNG